MSNPLGTRSVRLQKMMPVTTARGPSWPLYLTTRLFVFLVKVQGQYSVRRALAEATSEVSAIAP